MSRAELKHQAKTRLRGHWGWAIGLSLLGAIMAGIVSYVTFGILGLMMTAGLEFSYLAMIDHGDRGSGIFNNIFSGFTQGRGLSVFLTNLLITIFTFLWSLLLLIPGIIKAFSYSQANYIIKDMAEAGTEIGATDAITASRELMRGHKFDYFVLQLSFLGWALLATLTLGIGYLWLMPYMAATNAAFYRSIAGDRFLLPDEDAEFADF